MVIFTFWMAAMLLCLVALGLLLPPLLRSNAGDRRDIERQLAALQQRRKRDEIDAATHAAERERLSRALVDALERTTPAPARQLAVLLAVVVPASAVALYFLVGQPQALDPQVRAAPSAQVGSPQQMEQAIAGLEQRLRAQPDQVDGWLLLARSYRATERFDDMLRATTNALALAPNMPDVLVEHAEALALNSSSRRFDIHTRGLLEQALATDANHQKALWLLGVAALQDADHAGAARHWQRLRELLPAGDPIAARIDEQIAALALPASSGIEADTERVATPTSPADSGPQVLVTVELDAALADQVGPGDTLFVFARNPAGGPPLAIRRVDGPQFPSSLSLSPADRMVEGLQLQTGAEVSIGARISRSGQAQPEPGDLQAQPQLLTINAVGSTLVLRIDQVVP